VSPSVSDDDDATAWDVMSRPVRRQQPLGVVVLGAMDEAGSGDLSNELLRAKSLLLYADHVQVETFRASFLMARFISQMRTVGVRPRSASSGMIMTGRNG
jgi:hypothetical protein